MKVAMVTPFPEETGRIVGGVAGVSTYLAEALSALPDIEMEVVATNISNKQGLDEINGLPVRFLGGGGVRRVPGMRLLRELPRLVRQVLTESEFDIVHVQAYANVAASLQWPNVFTVHGIPELDARWAGPPGLSHVTSRARAAVERISRAHLENAIIISPYVADVLAGQLDCRTWNIPNPVAESFFQIARDPAPGRILYAGVLSRRKNVEGLLRAFALLVQSRPEATLRLAGSGVDSAYGRRCRALVTELGMSRSVAFLGSLTTTELQHEMGRASCLVLVSLQETAPLVIEEAMAAGVPVVASRVGGVPDLVSHDQTGLLVDPGVIPDVVDALNAVLVPDNVQQMGMAARHIADRRFRASNVALQTREVYRQVLEARG